LSSNKNLYSTFSKLGLIIQRTNRDKITSKCDELG
jgi:hypothetical protein